MSASDQEVNVVISSEYDDSGTSQATTSLSGLRSSIHGLSHSMILAERSSFMMMRAQEEMAVQANRVATAQENYNMAVAKYGANSEQATKAHRSLEAAMTAQLRMQQMLKMEQEMWVTRTAVMMLDSLIALTSEQTALNIASGNWIPVAATIAEMGVAAYTMGSALSMATSSPSTTPTGFAAGGVVPATGMYMLHGGETVNTKTGAESSGGGDTYHIHVSGALNADDMANQVMDAIERRKRTKFPTNSRTY